MRDVRCQDGNRRRDAVLQVPVTNPGTVETQPLAELDDLQRGLVAGARVVAVEQPDDQEAQLVQGRRGWWHAANTTTAWTEQNERP
jgi:hypothetical protein